jgi:hypothetical protein
MKIGFVNVLRLYRLQATCSTDTGYYLKIGILTFFHSTRDKFNADKELMNQTNMPFFGIPLHSRPSVFHADIARRHPSEDQICSNSTVISTISVSSPSSGGFICNAYTLKCFPSGYEIFRVNQPACIGYALAVICSQIHISHKRVFTNIYN